MLPAGGFEALDAALIGMRRFWAGSFLEFAQRRPGTPLEMSTVLVADAVSRGREGEVTVADVAAALDVSRSTASRLVDRAVSAGVVRRGTSPHDARRAVITLTAAGQRLDLDARAFRRSLLEDVVGAWRPDDVATLTSLLDRFADGFRTRRAAVGDTASTLPTAEGGVRR